MVVLGASTLGACSSDTFRFGGDPDANPYQTSRATPRREPASTGSIQAAPSARVERAPLGAPSGPQARPMRGFDGGQGGGRGDGEYRSSSLEPRTTGSLPPVRAGAPASSSNWSGDGGSVVTLRQGESIHTLSQRYGVPASAIMQANNLQSANGVGPGRQLVIPVYSGAGGPSAPQRMASASEPESQPRSAPEPMRPQPAAGQQGRMQFVTGPQAKGAEAPKPAPLKPAPAVQKTAAAPAIKPAVEAQQPESQAFAAPSKPVAQSNDNVKTASLKTSDPAPEAAPTGPSFRWPVRGRVISAYGSKTSGASNDGINLAVPEGTDVKASDDGVVAYAGSELKGFGNLVLIRHSNGWVTAYAHNSKLNVKRGDSVRRGQVIAESGATGNVTSPQLHFEVRKGATSVNPLDHLPNA
ncbi:lipoprotein [Hansschlegelia plantiphila]|uniref:Lipoprotein n=1 Tax=Hansschlegelia plantiphila TaxID=374655 RepID=A0A9W6MV36_9HYPH|nr:lipoprotein [Hansschlegelia plantiphila]